MSLREITYEELQLNPMTMIGGEWWLITAGNEENGNNGMTASWGHMGTLWERPDGKRHMGLPTISVYVRPSRYTKEFMDREEYFTLSVLKEGNKKALGYLGSHSGRDGDKIEEAGLTRVFSDGTTYYEEAKMVFICKKLYSSQLSEDGFYDKSIIDNNYPQKDFHYMYVGEIVKVLIEA